MCFSFKSTLIGLALIGLLAASTAGTHVYGQDTDREKILDSAEWKETIRDLQQWSSVQQIYDKAQLEKKKQELDEKVAEMSAEELKDFLRNLQEKLKILNSDEARAARTWLDQTMSVAAPAYAKKIRAGLPDITEMTASQLQLQLDVYQKDIASKKQYAEDFSKERADQAKQIREQRIRDEKARLESQKAASRRSNYNFTAPVVRRYRPVYPSLWGGYRW